MIMTQYGTLTWPCVDGFLLPPFFHCDIVGRVR